MIYISAPFDDPGLPDVLLHRSYYIPEALYFRDALKLMEILLVLGETVGITPDAVRKIKKARQS